MKATHKIKTILTLLAVMIMLLVVSVTWAQDAETHETAVDEPAQVINELQSALLTAMREGDRLSFEERFNRLAPIIDSSHNLGLIIRTALGSHWLDLDQEQQQVISSIFRQLSIATYASRFNEYSGEQFEVIQERDLPRNQQLIRSQLIKADKSTVDFDYVLQQGKEGWQIANILVNGVSDLALKRTEYRAILERDGFDALVVLLNEKVHSAEQG